MNRQLSEMLASNHLQADLHQRRMHRGCSSFLHLCSDLPQRSQATEALAAGWGQGLPMPASTDGTPAQGGGLASLYRME